MSEDRSVLATVTREVLGAVGPIVAFVLVLHFTLVPLGSEGLWRFLLGSVLVALGLGLFLLGIKIGFVPLGERIGAVLPEQMGAAGVLGFAALFSIVVTLADPNVQILSSLVDTASGGTVPPAMLVLFLAIGVGVYTALSIVRVFLEIPLSYILIPSYALAFILSWFVKPQYLSVAFDSGGVTTGPLIVPFIMALNVGIVSVLGVRDRVSASFGLVAMIFIGPILAVLLLGLIYS